VSPALLLFNNPGLKNATRKHALLPHVNDEQNWNLSPKNEAGISQNVGNFLAAASLQHSLV